MNTENKKIAVPDKGLLIYPAQQQKIWVFFLLSYCTCHFDMLKYLYPKGQSLLPSADHHIKGLLFWGLWKGCGEAGFGLPVPRAVLYAGYQSRAKRNQIRLD